MADPFTVLGTASSVITFVEFTWKLLSGTRSVYKSAAGQSDENVFISVITEDVSRLNDKIVASPECSNDLRDIADKSRKVACELLGALRELQAKDATVWKSFKVALKDVWSKGKIEALSQRLEKLQRRVASHIQLDILYYSPNLSMINLHDY